MTMAVVQISTAPNRTVYEKVTSLLSLADPRPAGLISHTAVELPTGEVQIIDVYATGEQLRSFSEQRLFPAFEQAGVMDMVMANERPVVREAFHTVTPG
jgi:hypothetical protein